MSFGIGMVCWLVLGSVVLNRLFFRPNLPAALVPTATSSLGVLIGLGV
jgi:tellurite resistance protein